MTRRQNNFVEYHTHKVMIYTFNQDVFVLTYDGNYDVRVFVM